MPSFRLAGAALALSLAAPVVSQTCQSFGIDFQSGETYFQNSLSNDPFTALQEFEGCQNDVSHNIFVDPNGDQSECSETPLQPDDTPQLINCTQWPKSSLFSGDWSLLIISNNGNGDPIAYERDFSLVVGPQQTETVTPTITVSSVSTPATTITTTSTTTSTITQMNQVTAKAMTSTTTTTKALLSITQWKNVWDVESTVETVPASCVTPTSSRSKDPIAHIKPTILGELDNIAADIIDGVLDDVGGLFGGNRLLCGLFGCKRAAGPVATAAPELSSGSAKFKRAVLEGRTPNEEVKRAYVAERAARLRPNGIEKRAPDAMTVTSTATTGLITTTVLSVAPTATATDTDVLTSSVTTQIYSTIQLPPVTITRTRRVAIAQVTRTVPHTTTITNYVTTTSAGAIESCASASGVLA